MKKKERRNREKAKKKEKRNMSRRGWVGSGQTSHGSKWVIFKRVNRVTGCVYPYFSNKLFFFNYKNKSMTACLEKMNKIN